MQSTQPSQPRAQRPREVYLHGEPSVKPHRSSHRSSQRSKQPSHRRALLSSLPLVIGLVIVWLLLFGLNSRIFGQAANDNPVFLPLVSQEGAPSSDAIPIATNEPLDTAPTAATPLPGATNPAVVTSMPTSGPSGPTSGPTSTAGPTATPTPTFTPGSGGPGPRFDAGNNY